MLKLLQYCKYVIIVMQIKLMLLLLLLVSSGSRLLSAAYDSMLLRVLWEWRDADGCVVSILKARGAILYAILHVIRIKIKENGPKN